MVENSVYCRKRSIPNLERTQKYQNYSSEVVDGEVKLTPSPVVAPALAESASVIMNSLVNKGRVPLRGRLVVDAVDLKDTFEKVK